MQVTIMYRNTYEGGDGWIYYPMTVEIGDRCPKCGSLRGKPKWLRQCEDGEYFDVQVWDNDCGHVDAYKEVFNEAKALSKRKSDYLEVVEELKSKGTLAGTIEYGPDDEWLGMVYEKNLKYTNPKEQDHFANCIFNGEKRV
ncbi:TPA: hypothetical protein ACMDTC_004283 [Vibrio parahaemolyticus]